MNKIFKYLFLLVFIIIVLAAGFTFSVREGNSVIVSRFGRIINIYNEAGLYFKLPWPVDNIIVFDARSQYLDSGYIEVLTNDRINIILQNYLVWKISDAERFYTSVGDFNLAHRHLNNIVTNAKNTVLGSFAFSSLVSTNIDELRLDEITYGIEENVSRTAFNNFGIEVQALRIKRIALPDANIQSVFNQMIAERQRYITQYHAEGERDAAIIISEAESRSAEIIAAGRMEAAEITAETERLVAEIYGEAYDRNSELFIFLRNLIALENSVNPDTVLIMRAGESPFNLLIAD